MATPGRDPFEGLPQARLTLPDGQQLRAGVLMRQRTRDGWFYELQCGPAGTPSYPAAHPPR